MGQETSNLILKVMRPCTPDRLSNFSMRFNPESGEKVCAAARRFLEELYCGRQGTKAIVPLMCVERLTLENVVLQHVQPRRKERRRIQLRGIGRVNKRACSPTNREPLVFHERG
jgi:hypothetical protein